MARLAIGVIDPQAWVIDDTGQAKEGTASACVARQYSGTLGKIGNCQVAVSVYAVTDAACACRSTLPIQDLVVVLGHDPMDAHGGR